MNLSGRETTQKKFLALLTDQEAEPDKKNPMK
jgi:hypothetical protein